jgi:predicted metal-dependent enzyme (double-stranded beta helix superfamily)
MSLVTDAPSTSLAPLHEFVEGFDALIARTRHEPTLLMEGEVLLARLIARDDWLPETHAAPDPIHYRQYLLHRDPAARYSVVSFVWGPGQSTPIHDHTIWGLVGVLRGAEIAERFALDADGLRLIDEDRLQPGAVDAVSPRIGDVHRVRNAFDDRVSISIHVYGADIGAVSRHTYDHAGRQKTFVSGYADAPALHI